MLFCSKCGKYSNEYTSINGDMICRECWLQYKNKQEASKDKKQ
ncbi:MAG: hypothetical protein R2680_12215 [Nitrososphaeraceae archaeon]